MKKCKALLLLVALALVPALRTTAQQMPQVPQVPMDTAIRYGKLPNGLTYYIRHNALPENRANFYIAQKVGSVQEDDSQRGLAHFLEHMCFNGTDNFPGDRLIKYCESIGVKFGVNLNAYTSTDETVYNIDDVPVTPQNVDSCLLILHDWADGLTLDPKEIDKERGVIHEEWRLRSDASGRIFERNLPALYPGSKYGHRYPIGLMEVVDNFKPEALRAYYEKWYRPDLQGIIVVGDIDVDQVEAAVKRIFGPIEMPQNAAAYETYPVPANNEPIYVIDKDKEQQQNVIRMMFKHEPMPVELRGTMAFFGYRYMTQMAASMLNARLGELSQEASCPFIYAGCQDGSYLLSKTMDAFTLVVLPKPGQDAEAVKAVMQEVERADRFGFTATELIRSREEFLSQMDKIYQNRTKQRNDFYVPQYVRHFLDNLPIPDITTEVNIYKQLAPAISADVISQVFGEMTASKDTNFVFLAMYPDKEGVAIPTADSFKQAIAAAEKAELTAYVDNVKNEPLVPGLPKKGSIVSEAKDDFGYTCWTLSNGARVYWRQTDFNDSEVLMSARSFGGLSKIKQEDLVNAHLLGFTAMVTGTGNFTSVELEKALAGKQAAVYPSLSNFSETLAGQSTPKDLRTLFELTYLRFQQPANDTDAFNNGMAMLRTQLENAEKDPMTAFSDSVSATLFNHNPRVINNLKLADLDKVDYQTIRRIWQERFQSASDFDFYFTGNFNVDSLRAFTEQYIASIPSAGKREMYDKVNVFPRKGTVTNSFRRQMETPKANIQQMWTGTTDYSLAKSVVADALGQVLESRYLKSIREDAGLAYTVGAQAQVTFGMRDQYALYISVPAQPAKCDSALLLMKQGIDEVAKNGVTDEELQKIKEYELKTFADNQRKNAYWQSLIVSKSVWGYDERTGFEELVKKLSSKDIQKFLKDVVLKNGNCVTVVMQPTDLTEKQPAQQ